MLSSLLGAIGDVELLTNINYLSFAYTRARQSQQAGKPYNLAGSHFSGRENRQSSLQEVTPKLAGSHSSG